MLHRRLPYIITIHFAEHLILQRAPTLPLRICVSKKDINDLAPVLADIMRLKTYTYHLLDNESDEPVSYGLMAQELQQVFPDMVTKLEPANDQSLLGINYSNFGVLAIKAIQEQQQVIEAQGKLILAQEARLATLEKLVNDLKTVVEKTNK